MIACFRIGRSVAPLAAAILLVAAAAGATATDAKATSHTPFQQLIAGSASQEDADKLLRELEQRYKPDFNNLSRWEQLANDENLTASQKKTLRTYLLRSGMAAKWLPKVGLALTRVSIPLTAAWVGYTVYREFSGGGADDELDMWLDSATLGQDSLFNLAGLPTANNAHYYADGVYWGRQIGGCPTGTSVCYRLVLTVSTNWGAGHEFGTDYLASPSMLSFDNLDPPENSLHSTYGWASFVERCDVGNDCPDQTWTPSGSISVSAGREVLYALDATILNLVSDHPTTTLYVNGEDSLGYDTRGVYLTEGEMTGIVGGGAVTAPPTGDTVYGDDISFTVPANAGQTIGQAKAVAESGSGACWEAFINWTVAPSLYPWSATCFATGEGGAPVPEPGTGSGGAGGVGFLALPALEDWTTAGDYFDALRAAGFTGTVHFQETCGDPWPHVGDGVVRMVLVGADCGDPSDYGRWEGSLGTDFGEAYWYNEPEDLDQGTTPLTAPADVEIWIERQSGGDTDPDGTAWPTDPITLPDPQTGETFAEYVARLRLAGYLGTIAVMNTWSECAECLAAGAGVVQSILTAAGEPMLDAIIGAWIWLGPGIEASTSGEFEQGWYRHTDAELLHPQISGHVARSGTVTIMRNPGDEAAEEGLELGPIFPPSGGSPGTCDHAPIGGLDVTPITQMELGDKFPFGVFTWAAGILGLFNVEADAPSWAINVPSVGADYVIDLEPFSPYMATMRTVVAWLLWIGAVWYLATSLLGFRATGNPGDAVDSYLDTF